LWGVAFTLFCDDDVCAGGAMLMGVTSWAWLGRDDVD